MFLIDGAGILQEHTQVLMNNNRQASLFPLLETERLILRELRAGDVEAIFQFLSDEEVVRYYDQPMIHLQQAYNLIQRHRTRFENGEAIRWGITIKGENRVVGSCGFFRDITNFYAGISYVLDRPYWNKGFMTEALQAMIPFGFNSYHLNRIEAHIAQPNQASQRVLEKLGFREEGILRQRLFENNRFHDEKVFSLLKSDDVGQKHMRM